MLFFLKKVIFKIKGISIGPYSIVHSTNIGKACRIWSYVNIMSKARIGINCNICDRCFIEDNVIIGDNVTIKTGVSLWNGVVICDDVFIGPGVQFCNDKYPRSKNYLEAIDTYISQGASIGAGATILPGITIGKGAMVGAGSVVTKNVADHSTVAGNPAKELQLN